MKPEIASVEWGNDIGVVAGDIIPGFCQSEHGIRVLN